MMSNISEHHFDHETVIVICGPTASGKSALAISLAKFLRDSGLVPKGAEIISADSMQIYKNLDVGTAKITAEESSGIKHHLIDICDPDEYYSVAQYKKDATTAIRDIHSRNMAAIVCGGTGQYLSALIEGIEFIETPVDVELRVKLNSRADHDGLEKMLSELQALDPETASKLSVSDRKRIVRAHEIIAATGKTPTQVNYESRLKGPDFKFKSYCLSPDRGILYERINARTINMLNSGWIEETKKILLTGIPDNCTSMQAIGYRQIVSYLNGVCTLDEITAAIQQATRRYAKRQLTWFRKMPQLKWIDSNYDNALEIIVEDLQINS